MADSKVYLVPLIEGIWYTINIVVMYTLAVSQSHVYPIFPYVSDIGAFFPESGIFRLTMNVGALLMIWTIMLRYGYVKQFCRSACDDDDTILKLNARSTVIGVIASSSVSVLGDFGIMESLIVHLIASTVAFNCGNFYMCAQVWISIKMYPGIGHRNVIATQVLFATLAVLSTILVVLFGALSFWCYEGSLTKFDFTKWSPIHGGYKYHLVSVFAEWVLIFSTIFFLTAYSFDFSNIEMLKPTFRMKQEKK